MNFDLLLDIAMEDYDETLAKSAPLVRVVPTLRKSGGSHLSHKYISKRPDGKGGYVYTYRREDGSTYTTGEKPQRNVKQWLDTIRGARTRLKQQMAAHPEGGTAEQKARLDRLAKEEAHAKEHKAAGRTHAPDLDHGTPEKPKVETPAKKPTTATKEHLAEAFAEGKKAHADGKARAGATSLTSHYEQFSDASAALMKEKLRGWDAANLVATEKPARDTAAPERKKFIPSGAFDVDDPHVFRTVGDVANKVNDFLGSKLFNKYDALGALDAIKQAYAASKNAKTEDKQKAMAAFRSMADSLREHKTDANREQLERIQDNLRISADGLAATMKPASAPQAPQTGSGDRGAAWGGAKDGPSDGGLRLRDHFDRNSPQASRELRIIFDRAKASKDIGEIQKIQAEIYYARQAAAKHANGTHFTGATLAVHQSNLRELTLAHKQIAEHLKQVEKNAKRARTIAATKARESVTGSEKGGDTLKAGKIRLATREGYNEVDGKIIGNYGVHEVEQNSWANPTAKLKARRTVTHLPSGYKLGDFDTPTIAARVAKLWHKHAEHALHDAKFGKPDPKHPHLKSMGQLAQAIREHVAEKGAEHDDAFTPPEGVSFGRRGTSEEEQRAEFERQKQQPLVMPAYQDVVKKSEGTMTIKRGDYEYNPETREHRRAILVEPEKGHDEFSRVLPLNLRKSEPEVLISLRDPEPLRKSAEEEATLIVQGGLIKVEGGTLTVDPRAARHPYDDNG